MLCVLCGVPKGRQMEKEMLITLWMAHGFLLLKGKFEPEEIGNELWNELYLRSLFQEIEVKGGYTYFKMHDLIHDLAASLFLASASRSNIRKINLKEDMMSVGFAELVPSYSPSILKKFVSFRVLNLSSSGLKQLPSSIGDVVHLRYLNLSANFKIRSLPKQLCKLQNLQTLDLHHCWSLSCLPKQTSKLGSLRNLLLDGCLELTCMPPRIGSLTCLKTLSLFVVGERKGYQLGDLRNLNLYGSIEITHLDRVKNNKDAKEANLSAKENLQFLRMSWAERGPHRYESEEAKVLEALKSHPNLKSLEIRAFRGSRLPDWMNHPVLKNVVCIEILSCINCSCVPPFGELPCLESLKLWNGSAEMEYVEEDVDVHPGLRRFPSLRKLRIGYFHNLKGLLRKDGEEQFPMLEEMWIHYCPVFVFPTLSSVKKLQVSTGLTSISNLRALTYLCISHNSEDTLLPEEMFKSLTNLKYLKISRFNNLKELPSSLASLNEFQSLEIDSCDGLESLPEEGVKGLTSLTELSINYCKMLKCLPEGLQHLTSLTTLTVSRCSILYQRCEKEIGED